MRRPLRAAAPALAALLLAAPLAAQPADGPRRADLRPWLLGGGAALAGAVLLDRTLDGTVPDGGGTRWEGASDALNHGGRPQLALAALGGVWATSRLAGREETADAAVRITAALAAAGVANGALKYGVGRERPGTTDAPDRFRPGATDNRWQSFPSGHATVAFALAAAVSEEAGRPWVTAASYGTAALVGWSRVYEDKHWTSDVVAGALIGTAAGRLTTRHLRRRARDGAPAVAVTPLPGGVAVSLPAF